jgi:GTP-binding protein EngB required for normal cell division
MQSRPLSMVPFGGPGSGKSTSLNMLVGQVGFFKSSKTTKTGQTQEISSFKGPAFGISGMPTLHVFDAPGVGDSELPIVQIVADIKKTIGTDQPIDAALIVLKSLDFRMDI